MTSAPRIWITRTAPAAQASALKLAALGFVPIVAPVLETVFVGGAPDLSGVAQIAFTSVNVVDAFAQSCPRRDLPAVCVGEATAAAAAAAGFLRILVGPGAGRGVLEVLLARPRPGKILVVAPAEPAFDLDGALRAAGCQTQAFCAYQTRPADSDFPETFDAALVYSAKAAEAIVARASPERRQRPFLCLSPQVAAPLIAAGFAQVMSVDRPREDDLLQRLDHLRPSRA